MLSENDILTWILDSAGAGRNPLTRVGIGDDAAVLRALPSDQEALWTTDQVVENQHFTRTTHPPAALGRKSLTRGVSDIAAMGGRPLVMTMSLGLPRWVDPAWLKQYINGMFLSRDLFELNDLDIVGGDLSASEIFTVCVGVLGAAPAGRALLRSGARPGDRVWVSGRVGGSALGLERLLRGEVEPDDAAVDRHLNPTPRLALGRFLIEAGASAAIDLTDGLALDLSRLAAASGAGAVIRADRPPRFEGAGAEHVLRGGEEYELIFTAPPATAIPAEFEGLPLTAIGEIVEDRGLFEETRDGRRPLAPRGFDHFARG